MMMVTMRSPRMASKRRRILLLPGRRGEVRAQQLTQFARDLGRAIEVVHFQLDGVDFVFQAEHFLHRGDGGEGVGIVELVEAALKDARHQKRPGGRDQAVHAGSYRRLRATSL